MYEKFNSNNAWEIKSRVFWYHGFQIKKKNVFDKMFSFFFYY